MPPDSRQQLAAMFAIARELSAADRAIYLERECSGRPELRRQIEDLLASDRTGDDFLERPAWDQLATESRGNIHEGALLGLPVEAILGGAGMLHPQPSEEAQPSAEILQVGSVVAGRFEIGRLLGRGGMGVVYQAWDKVLDRNVALKMLSGMLSTDPDGARRLHREAAALASLRHENICSVYDLFESEYGECIVMEYLEGRTLAERHREDPVLGASEAVNIAIDVVVALGEAHRHGVLHRDIKPGNIMLTAQGTKLLDFGIASSVRGYAAARTGDRTLPESAETVTMQGHSSVAGTVQYMSPEQVLGLALDERSDLFSLGVVLFQAVTGELPFRGATQADVLGSIVHARPALVRQLNPRLPRALEEIVDKCLSREPNQRYASAGELLRDLRRLLEYPGVEPHRKEKIEPASVVFDMRALGAIALFASAIALVVYRSNDLRGAVHLALLKQDAIERSRAIAIQLGCPAETLVPQAVLAPSFAMDQFLAAHGSSALLRVLRSGYSFAWQTDFAPRGVNAGDTYEGCSVGLDVSGRFLHYGARLRSAADYRTRGFPPGKEAELARQYLRVPSSAVIAPGKQLSLPTDFRGWSEKVLIFLAEGRVMSVEQVLREDGNYTNLRTYSRISESLSGPLAQARVTSECIVFLSGFALFIARRRYIALSWRVPTAVTISLWVPFACAMVAGRSAKPLTGASVLDAVSLCLLSLPAAAGLYAWIRHLHSFRTVGLEQMMQTWGSSEMAVREMNQGVLAGVILGSLSLFQFVSVQLSRQWPDISWFYQGIASSTPLSFDDYAAGFGALIAALCLGATYEFIAALTRSQKVATIVVILAITLLYGDVAPSVTAFAFWFMRIALLVVLYWRSGLLAVAAAHMTSMFVVASVVASHLSNSLFLAQSMLVLCVFVICVASLNLRAHRAAGVDAATAF